MKVVAQRLPLEKTRIMPVSFGIFLLIHIVFTTLIPNEYFIFCNYVVWIDDGAGGRLPGSGKEPKKPEPKTEPKKKGGFKFPWDK